MRMQNAGPLEPPIPNVCDFSFFLTVSDVSHSLTLKINLHNRDVIVCVRNFGCNGKRVACHRPRFPSCMSLASLLGFDPIYTYPKNLSFCLRIRNVDIVTTVDRCYLSRSLWIGCDAHLNIPITPSRVSEKNCPKCCMRCVLSFFWLPKTKHEKCFSKRTISMFSLKIHSFK